MKQRNMNQCKKVLSCVLIACLCLGVIPTYVLTTRAAEDTAFTALEESSMQYKMNQLVEEGYRVVTPLTFGISDATTTTADGTTTYVSQTTPDEKRVEDMSIDKLLFSAQVKFIANNNDYLTYLYDSVTAAGIQLAQPDGYSDCRIYNYMSHNSVMYVGDSGETEVEYRKYYTLDKTTAGVSDFQNKDLEIWITTEFVRAPWLTEGEEDDVKIGIWFNGVLNGGTYFYVLDCKSHTYDGYVKLNPVHTIASPIMEPNDMGMVEGEYTSAEGTAYTSTLVESKKMDKTTFQTSVSFEGEGGTLYYGAKDVDSAVQLTRTSDGIQVSYKDETLGRITNDNVGIDVLNNKFDLKLTTKDIDSNSDGTNDKLELDICVNDQYTSFELEGSTADLKAYVGVKTEGDATVIVGDFTSEGPGQIIVDTTPTITASGVSIRIPDETTSTKGGLRFKTTVNTPFADGVEVVEQGTLLIPFYINGENELNLDTKSVLKIPKSEGNYYTYEEDYYEFVAVLTDIPVCNLRSTICARGYLTYTVDGGEAQTVYSDMVIYDIYSIAKKVMTSETEKEATKVAVDEFIIDAYEAYSKTDGGNEEGLLTITSPAVDETVYPYEDHVKNYLLAVENYEQEIDVALNQYVDVTDYRHYAYTDGYLDCIAPINITWSNQYENVASFTVMYATQSDFSDAKYAHASARSNSVKVYNLFKATDYYVKVIANLKDGTTRTTTSTFKTADLGPRVIHLDGSANIRDLGGYMTSSGKRTLQGLIYRGGQMDDQYWNGSRYFNTEITAYGNYAAQNELGIKVDLDFRTDFATTNSPIQGATHEHIPVKGYYLNDTANKEYIRQTFSMFSNINNYPIIFHCQGGADRTGTIAYLFNALLGVSEKDIVRDYEFTSFSIYDRRAIWSTSYLNKNNGEFYTTLESQAGNTLQEKVENYLLGCGVTAEEIANIKAIMFGEVTKRSVKFPSEICTAVSSELELEINGNLNEIYKVYVAGEAVDWHTVAGGIAVNVSDFPSTVVSGDLAVRVEFVDGEMIDGTVTCDATPVVDIGNYINDTTLDSSNLTVTSNSVGYGKWVRMHLEATNTTYGKIFVFIGSYGAQFRSNATRYCTYNGTTGATTDTVRPSGHTSINEKTFESGNSVYLYEKVELIDDTTAKITVITTDQNTAEVLAQQSYTVSRLTSGEIASANAGVTFMIDGSDTTKLVIDGTATVEE